jgi:3-oxoacyl-[acyl-carrier-protein] synthase III
MQPIAITSTGSYTPDQVLTNDELVQRFGLTVDHDWIVSRTGIHSRHWLMPGDTTSDLAVRAAQRCLARANVSPQDIDRLIVATISPDMPSPSTATIVARKLGMRCMAFDVSAACSGYLYGLEIAAGAIQMGARKVLVIGADARSRYLNPKDHRSMVLFADGAGCALVEPSQQPGLLSIVCGSQGQEQMGAYILAGGAQRPTTIDTVMAGEHYLQVDPKTDIFRMFVSHVSDVCQQALSRAGLTIADVDVFLTHQGNGPLIHLVAEAMGVAPEAVVDEVANHGNTAGASVAIVLDELIRSARIKPGSTVLLSAVGAGLTFAAAVHRF